jgi:hypothetical protein
MAACPFLLASWVLLASSNKLTQVTAHRKLLKQSRPVHLVPGQYCIFRVRLVLFV